jgi:Methylase involved in ubiquinone/menaquinone biosynthesis
MSQLAADIGKTNYLKVAYDPRTKPVTTAYPAHLAGYLVARYGLKPGDTLLDLGCGRGEMLAAFAQTGLACHGLDQSPDAGSCSPGASVLQADITKDVYPYPDNTFDVVFLKSVIEHVWEPGHMLAEILRILKPGGRALFLTPDFSSCVREFYEDPTHVRAYLVRSMRILLTMSGYDAVEAERFCHHERIWNSALGTLAADVCWRVLPLSWARWLAQTTGTKFVRWACERQILASGAKPA